MYIRVISTNKGVTICEEAHKKTKKKQKKKTTTKQKKTKTKTNGAEKIKQPNIPVDASLFFKLFLYFCGIFYKYRFIIGFVDFFWDHYNTLYLFLVVDFHE